MSDLVSSSPHLRFLLVKKSFPQRLRLRLQREPSIADFNLFVCSESVATHDLGASNMPDSKRPASGPPSAESYRQKALKLCAIANQTSDPFIRAELESLAFAYMRLAEEAEQPAAAPADKGENDVKPDEE